MDGVDITAYRGGHVSVGGNGRRVADRRGGQEILKEAVVTATASASSDKNAYIMAMAPPPGGD